MKHVMLDAYGTEEQQSSDMMHINNLLNKLTYNLGLDPVAPPVLIPYYYGSVKEDVGITAYVFLKGGHITIHTFPIRGCYFVDCLSQNDFDDKEFYQMFLKKLPFDEGKSTYQVSERKLVGKKIMEYTPKVDFGPHYMMQIKSSKVPSMDDMFDFLETIVPGIGMDEITRASVIKDSMVKTEWLSAIIIIAQSHIALHYSYESGNIYADVFSCAPFDYTVLDKEFSILGSIEASELIPRGTKHLYRIKNREEVQELLADTKWQKVVKKEGK